MIATYRVTLLNQYAEIVETIPVREFTEARSLALSRCPADGSANLDWIDQFDTLGVGYAESYFFTPDGEYCPARFVYCPTR